MKDKPVPPWYHFGVGLRIHNLYVFTSYPNETDEHRKSRVRRITFGCLMDAAREYRASIDQIVREV